MDVRRHLNVVVARWKCLGYANNSWFNFISFYFFFCKFIRNSFSLFTIGHLSLFDDDMVGKMWNIFSSISNKRLWLNSLFLIILYVLHTLPSHCHPFSTNDSTYFIISPVESLPHGVEKESFYPIFTHRTCGRCKIWWKKKREKKKKFLNCPHFSSLFLLLQCSKRDCLML